MKIFLIIIFGLTQLSLFAVTKINGAGASFPYPIYSKWFAEYQKKNSDVQFNYQAIGSGGGIRQVINSRSRSSGGSGLGLSIIKHIAQKHGGQAGHSYNKIDKRNYFYISFPKL